VTTQEYIRSWRDVHQSNKRHPNLRKCWRAFPLRHPRFAAIRKVNKGRIVLKESWRCEQSSWESSPKNHRGEDPQWPERRTRKYTISYSSHTVRDTVQIESNWTRWHRQKTSDGTIFPTGRITTRSWRYSRTMSRRGCHRPDWITRSGRKGGNIKRLMWRTILRWLLLCFAPCSTSIDIWYPYAFVAAQRVYKSPQDVRLNIPRLESLTLTIPSLLAAASLVADRSKHTEFKGCCPASIVPISATIRASHILTTPSASQDATCKDTIHHQRWEILVLAVLALHGAGGCPEASASGSISY